MMQTLRALCAGAAAYGIAALTLNPTCAAQDFYKGRTITIFVAAGAGGGYGHYAQLIAQHLGQFLPGQPSVILSYMPGAGGINAANHVYNIAPKDGTALGVLLSTVPVQGLMEPAARFDVNRFQWIGVVVPVIQTLTVMRHAPALTLDSLKQTEIVAGSTGVASDTYVVPRLANYGLGTRIRIVTGYKGTAEIALAMTRGELHAWAGPWTSKGAQFPHLLDPAQATQLFQFGLAKFRGRENVPLLGDLVVDAAKKRVVEFLSGPTALGYSLTAPPDVPGERIAVLRKAFEDMLRDPGVRADAEKRKAVLEPSNGIELQATVARITAVPAAVVEEARRVLAPEAK